MPSALAHHFDTPEQQYESATLGMWLFLATEILFFGGLFTGYVVYRSSYPDAFAEGSRHLDLILGATNTVVLLTSSLTMAMGVYSAQTGRKKPLIGFLIATAVLGVVFFVIKSIEYAHKFEEGIVPGREFTIHLTEGVDVNAQHVQLFFSFYYAMTGVHALHMIIGLGLLTTIAVMAARDRFSPEYYTPVEMTGLYWHFVDLVWIYLFPLLYLIGAHG